MNAVSGLSVETGWRRMYQISFFFGYIVSASLYYTFNKLFFPPGLEEQVDFDVDGSPVIDGVPVTEGKSQVVVEAKS